MIIYNVTVNIDDDAHKDWVRWMKDDHIPEVMATGYFLDSRFARVMVEEQQGTTYSIQYMCKNQVDLDEYQREQAPRLQADHSSRFEGKFVAFRTLLEIVE
jgi:hypothetical protein